MKDVKDVMPIRSQTEYESVLQAIETLSKDGASDARDCRLRDLRQRAEAYEQRQRIDPERLRALEDLANEAQKLGMGYE